MWHGYMTLQKGKEKRVLRSVAQVSASLILSVSVCSPPPNPPPPSLSGACKKEVWVLLCLKHRKEQGVREVRIERGMYFIIYYLSLVNPRRLNGSVYVLTQCEITNILTDSNQKWTVSYILHATS